MAKLWAIIKREYLERVRSKWFLIATFFGPIFFSAIIIVPAWLASRSKATTDVYNTTILDATGTGFGHRLAVNIAGDSTIPSRMPTVRVVAPNELTPAESVATHEVMRKERTGYVVVNQQTLAGESARYAGTNATSIADMAQIKSAIRQTILASRLEKVGLDNEKMKELTFIPLDFSTERITERGRAGSGMASVLFGFAIGFLLGFIFYSSLYAAVGSSVNSESEARQAASPLMIMIVSTGVFIQPVLLNPTGTTAKVLSLIPISSPIIMPIRMAVTGVPPLELAGSLAFLAIGCVLALWLASRIYRVGLLMYGKRPTMKEMARWVSYAR